MAESTLAMGLADLQVEVGRFLGYGSGDTEQDDAAWTTRQERRITEAIKGGLRKFYFAPGVNWSFLKPVAQVTLAEDANYVNMPDDFGEPEGEVIIAELGSHSCKVPITGIGQVLGQRAAYPDATGQPQCVCFQALAGTTGTQGQRKRMEVYPAANQAYTLQVRYYILPNALTESRPFHYGGAQHAETIKYACLAAAEMLEDNRPGAMAAEFARLLDASIQWDRKAGQQVFGFNLDRSDGTYVARPRGAYTVTFDGVAYGS